MVESEKILYPVLMDEKSEVAGLYGIRSIPTVIIIDRDGIVAEHHIGSYEKDDLLKVLEANR